MKNIFRKTLRYSGIRSESSPAASFSGRFRGYPADNLQNCHTYLRQFAKLSYHKCKLKKFELKLKLKLKLKLGLGLELELKLELKLELELELELELSPGLCLSSSLHL